MEKTYARIIDNEAVDVTVGDPAELYHPDVAAQFEEVPVGTQNGARRDPRTGDWSAAPVGSPAPNPPVATPMVPQQVTRRQARQALLLAGLLDQVAPALATIADPVQRGLAQIEWEDSQVFERNRPVLLDLATALGLDDTRLDDLFITAAGL